MIVVADTSVLLNLAFVGLGDVLRILFGEVWMPETVVQEFERMSASNGRFKGLALPTCCKACVCDASSGRDSHGQQARCRRGGGSWICD